MNRNRGNSRQRPPELTEQLTHLIGHLVDEPEAVEVEEAHDEEGEYFIVHVDDGDLGKVIGRRGRTAHALRELLEIRGERDGRDYDLEIGEP